MKKRKMFSILFSLITVLAVSQYNNRQKIVFKNNLGIKLQWIKEIPFGLPVNSTYKLVQKFGNNYKGQNRNYHAGVDFNGAPGNADLGDPIYSINDGVVADAFTDNYLAIYYKLNSEIIKAVYYHCDTIYVKTGNFVKKGDLVATIGNSKGVYSAHLHLEFMRDTSIYFQGYVQDKKELSNFIDPEKILPTK